MASSSYEKVTVSLWVRPELFQLGVLPVVPHSKLALKFLKRIVPYAKSKSQLGYPKLSYSVWKHIACNKLQLPESMAWMYFVTFRTLYRGQAETCIQWDNHYGREVDSEYRDHVKSLTSVDTLKFVLLLFVQHCNKLSLRSSSFSLLTLDQYPNRYRGSEIIEKTASQRSLKMFDEHKHLAFISHRLGDILDLFNGDESTTSSAADNFVAFEIIEALSFLLEGSIDGNKNVVPIHEIILSPAIRKNFDLYTPKKGFAVGKFLSWIRANLRVYPFSTLSCLSTDIHSPIGNYLDTCRSSNGNMYTNISSGPKGHKFLVLSGFNKQTIAKSSEGLKGVTVHIHRCSNSFIYILVPLKSVLVTKCHETTIVLGPISSTLAVSVCKGLRIITICRRLCVSDCLSCTFHLLTPTQPLFVGNCNRELILAPFHTSYSKLEEHMLEAGIGHVLNLWDIPLCISDDGNVESQSTWHLLPPEEFYVFNIPFEFGGKTNVMKIPGTPVPSYQNALKTKKQQVESWHHLVKNANLDRGRRHELNKLVRARFQAWLILGGHQRELDGLVASNTLKLKQINTVN